MAENNDKVKELLDLMESSNDFKGAYNYNSLNDALSDKNKAQELYNLLETDDDFKGAYKSADDLMSFKKKEQTEPSQLPLESSTSKPSGGSLEFQSPVSLPPVDESILNQGIEQAIQKQPIQDFIKPIDIKPEIPQFKPELLSPTKRLQYALDLTVNKTKEIDSQLSQLEQASKQQEEELAAMTAEYDNAIQSSNLEFAANLQTEIQKHQENIQLTNVSYDDLLKQRDVQLKRAEDISKGIEQQAEKDRTGYFGDMFMAGLSYFNKSLASIPELIYDTYANYSNLQPYTLAHPEEALKLSNKLKEKYGFTNQLADYYATTQKHYEEEAEKKFKSKEFGDRIKDGEYLDAATQIFGSVAQSTPQMLMMMAASAAGVPYPSMLAGGTTVFASGEYADTQAEKDLPIDFDSTDKLANSWTKGALEFVFEEIPATSLNKFAIEVFKKEGVEKGKKIMTDVISDYFGKVMNGIGTIIEKPTASNALGEYATTVSQNIADYYTGKTKDKDFFKGSVESLLSGVAMGGAPELLGRGYKYVKNKRASKKLKSSLQSAKQELSNPNLTPETKQAVLADWQQSLSDLNATIDKDQQEYLDAMNMASEADKQKFEELRTQAEANEQKIELKQTIIESPDVSPEYRAKAQAELEEIEKDNDRIEKEQEEIKDNVLKGLEELINKQDEVKQDVATEGQAKPDGGGIQEAGKPVKPSGEPAMPRGEEGKADKNDKEDETDRQIANNEIAESDKGEVNLPDEEKQAKATGDKFIDFIDKSIEDLNKNKQAFSFLIPIPPAVIKLALKAVKATYIATKNLAKAIEKGLEEIRKSGEYQKLSNEEKIAADKEFDKKFDELRIWDNEVRKTFDILKKSYNKETGRYDNFDEWYDKSKVGYETKDQALDVYNEAEKRFKETLKENVKKQIEKETGVNKDRDDLFNKLKQSLRDQVKGSIYGFREGLRREKQNIKRILEVVNDILNQKEFKGKLSESQVKAIVRLSQKAITSSNPNKWLAKFDTLLDKIIEDQEYANKIDDIRSNQKSSRKRKHGSLTSKVREFTSINPYDIPDALFDKYQEAVNDINQKIPDYKKMNEIYDDIKAEIESNQNAGLTDEEILNMFDNMQRKGIEVTLGKITNVDEYKEISRKVSAIKRAAERLIENGAISQSDYDTIIDQTEKWMDEATGKFAQEIADLKQQQVASINNNLSQIDRTQFTKEELELIDRLVSATPSELESLSVGTLADIQDITERISNGYAPMYFLHEAVAEIESNRNAPEIAQEIIDNKNLSKKLENLKRGFEEEQIEHAIDEIGFNERSKLYKRLIAPFINSIARMKKDIDSQVNKFIESKPKGLFVTRSQNRTMMNKLGMALHYVTEFSMSDKSANNALGSNVGNRDWFGAMMGNKAAIEELTAGMDDATKQAFIVSLENEWNNNYSEAKRKEIEKAYQQLPKREVFDANGNKIGEVVDVEKIFNDYTTRSGNTFNESERKILDAFGSITEELTTKQKAATEADGKKFDMLQYYLRRKRYTSGSAEAIETGTTGATKTKSSARESRTDHRIGAVETNLESLLLSSIYDTNKDYHMTFAKKTLNKLSGAIRRELKGKATPEVINGVRDNMYDRLKSEFDKANSDAIRRLYGLLLSAKSAQSLYEPIRSVVEIISSGLSTPLRAGNIRGYADMINPKSRKVAQQLINDTESSLGLRFSKDIPMSGTVEARKKSLLSRIQSGVISAPEHITFVAAWYPSFLTEFERVTGEKFDSDKYTTLKSYRDNYNQQIKDASAYADGVTKRISGGGLKAESAEYIRLLPEFISKGARVKAHSTIGKTLGFLTNYTYREGKEFIKGFSEIAEGDVRQGIGRSAGVLINAMAYGTMMMTYGAIKSLMVGDDEEKEKAKQILKEITSPKEGLKSLALQTSNILTSRYRQVSRTATALLANAYYTSIDDKKEKEKIKQWMSDNLYITPTDFGQGSTKGTAEFFIGQVPAVQMLYSQTIKELGGKNGLKQLIDEVAEKGFDGLSDENKDKYMMLNVVLDATNTILMFMGTQVPMTKLIDREIESEIREAINQKKQTGTSSKVTLSEQDRQQIRESVKQAKEEIRKAQQK